MASLLTTNTNVLDVIWNRSLGPALYVRIAHTSVYAKTATLQLRIKVWK
jgi:hypothetical protein